MRMIIEYPFFHEDGRIPMSECGGLLQLVHNMFVAVSERVTLPADETEQLVLHAKVYRSSGGKPKAYCEISRLRKGKYRPGLFPNGGEMVVALATNINITEEGGTETKFGDGIEEIVNSLQEPA